MSPARRWRATLLALGCSLAVAATAHAQLGDVGQGTLDTVATPVAKDGKDAGWERVAGARFGAARVLSESPTPFDVDFFSVAFADRNHGFFAGAGCRRKQPGRATEGEAAIGCERVPVIYEYQDDGTGHATIAEAYRSPARGYVAQVAWIGTERALAVGGDGCYVRREGVPCPDRGEGSAAADPAGAARAWLYDPTSFGDSAWHELSDLPAGMRGAAALACSPDAAELCFAGAYRQLWRFSDGAFVKGFSDQSPESELQGARHFRFRVRAIAFANDANKTPVALTAGCCAANPAHNFPRLLASDAPDRWYVANPDSESDLGTPDPESFYAVTRDLAAVVSPDGPPPRGSPERASYVTQLGVPPRPSSDADQRALRRSDPALDRRSQSTIRLLSLDGWAVGELRSSATSLGAQGVAYVQPPPFTSLGNSPLTPSIHWSASNRLTSMWYDGRLHFYWHEVLLGCPFGQAGILDPFTYTQCDPNAPREEARLIIEEDLPQLPAAISPPPAKLYKVDSYALNSFQMLGGSGGGFAVGDHGALVRLGAGAAVAGDEPSPPFLGKPKPAPFSDRAPYEPYGPPTSDQAGEVEAFGAPATARLSEPRFVAAGSPDPASHQKPVQIVTSRDGSEGWAIGSGGDAFGNRGGPMTLFHYDGLSWRSCDPEGGEDGPPADPACEGEGDLDRVSLRAAARVPLERDADPTNDDEFEVIAVGSRVNVPGLSERAAILRYRDRRWSLDTEAMEAIDTSDLRDVAFTAPDDGWIVSGPPLGSGLHSPQQVSIFHFDGNRWLECGGDREACADPERRLPYGSLEPRTVGFSNANGRGVRLAVAGSRVYMFGTRAVIDEQSGQVQRTFPMVIYRDSAAPCVGAGDRGCWRAADGGYDPGFGDPPGADQGRAYYGAIAQRSDGRYEGWVTGEFGGPPLLHLKPDGGAEKWSEPAGSPGSDYGLAPADPGESAYPRQLVAVPGPDGEVRAFMAVGRMVLGFSPERQRWELVPTPWRAGEGVAGGDWGSWLNGDVVSLAGDGQGGLWAVIDPWEPIGFDRVDRFENFFYHYTDHPPRPVFEDVGPVRERITAVAGGGDGSFWVATDANVLYRHDRVGGWERVPIPGWDRGAVLSGVNALAIGQDGTGVAVGRGGRIADLGPDGVQLDPAAGKSCGSVPAPPCGTTHDLVSAAAGPDGSAMAGGAKLVWRPAGGEFRAIKRPGSAQSISLPTPERAYLLTGDGFIFRGELTGGDWSWQAEYDGGGARALAVDANGHGYAVGARGLVLERSGDGPQPWRRIDTGFRDNFSTVTLPVSSGSGALIGGEGGVILTRSGDGFKLARPADPYDPLNAGPLGSYIGSVVGLALLPGPEPGQAEAWAALDPLRPDPRQWGANSSILHYASHPDEPLLNPDRRASALPDTPPPRPGEISFAAFGKSDCHLESDVACPPMTGTSVANELIARRVTDDILEASERPGGPRFAVFTGDSNDAAGPGASEATSASAPSLSMPTDASRVHRRWRELVAERLQRGGVPLFAAVGGQDLSQAEVCTGILPVFCRNTSAVNAVFVEGSGLGAGLTNPWRQAMASMPAPWGRGDAATSGSLSFQPVPDPAVSRAEPDEDVTIQGLPRTNLNSLATPSTLSVSMGGARTHYALDLVDHAQGDRKLARLVVVDTSVRSLAGSDPNQNPKEPDGQAGWLEKVLCFEGSPEDTGGDVRDCTREPGQPAIVVSSTPTYTYAPISPVETQADAAAFETILMRYGVSVVVSGHLGWNGRYWALAPGLHYPCPGDPYREEPPEGASLCGQGAGGEAQLDDPGAALEAVPGTRPLAEQLEGVDRSLRGPLPFVVSSTAGGKYNDGAERADQATPERGFFRGYAIVRVDASGDPRKTIVEQRAAIDWVSLTGEGHTLVPRQRLALHGSAREAVAPDERIRYYEISSPAITHRYELLLADPEEPWLPCEADVSDCQALHSRLAPNLSSRAQASRSDAVAEGSGALATAGADGGECAPYLCLPERVGTVDDQSGEVSAGNGKYPDTFAIALLSVGEHPATWPLVFRKSPSFVVSPVAGFPALPSAPAGSATTAPQPSAPPSPPTPNVPQASVPNPPPVPPITPLQASEPPQPQPPAPPAPPPPAEQLSALSLTLTPPSVAFATPTAVIQPPTPPVNPAPPSGARREARQRQAATQKSGADGAEGSEMSDATGDLAQGKDALHGTNSMRRRERARPEPSFTAIAHADQPSAWAQGLLYTGGATLLAAALALGWSGVRPTPRRRPPEVPAPAFARARRHGR